MAFGSVRAGTRHSFLFLPYPPFEAFPTLAGCPMGLEKVI